MPPSQATTPPTPSTPPPRLRRARALRVLRWMAEGGLLLTAVMGLAIWWSVPDVAALRGENPTTTAFITLRRAQAAAAHRPFVLRWQWRSIHQIARYLRVAVVLTEDYRFYEHAGADWAAMWHAARTDFATGSLHAGGSTITQQLAKNLYLSPQRSLWRKARELAMADRLEAELTKTRILELYLNVVEWGDGVFGAEAAAQFWFGRSARSLTPAQAARLAVALPNPKTRSPNRQFGSLNQKCARLVMSMYRLGVISIAEQNQALHDLGMAKADADKLEGDQLGADKLDGDQLGGDQPAVDVPELDQPVAQPPAAVKPGATTPFVNPDPVKPDPALP